MQNTGNSCYFNAILQALTGLPPFVHAIRDSRLQVEGQRYEVVSSLFSRFSFKEAFLVVLKEAQDLVRSPINPSAVQTAISRKCRQFANKRQQVSILVDCPH